MMRLAQLRGPLEAWKQNAQERARQREAQEIAEKVAEEEKLRHCYKLADEQPGVTSGALGNMQSVVDWIAVYGVPYALRCGTWKRAVKRGVEIRRRYIRRRAENEYRT